MADAAGGLRSSDSQGGADFLVDDSLAEAQQQQPTGHVNGSMQHAQVGLPACAPVQTSA